MLNGLLGRVSLFVILYSGNSITVEVRKLVETPCRCCERKSKHVKRFMLGRVSLVGILCSGNSMTGCKKACRDTVKKEL